MTAAEDEDGPKEFYTAAEVEELLVANTSQSYADALEFFRSDAVETKRTTVTAAEVVQAEKDAEAVEVQREKLSTTVMRPDDIRNAPDMSFVVEDLLYADTTTVAAGTQAALKSFWAQDLVFRIAAEAELDYFGSKIVQGWALYVAAEGSAGIKQRMLAWEKHNGVKVQRLLLYPKPIDMGLPGAGEMVADWLRGELPPDAALVLSIWDTLSKIKGAKNENQQEIGDVLAQVSEARGGHPGGAAVILHHLSAEGRVRGNTAIGADADGVLLVARDKEAPVGEYRTVVTAEKVKDGDDDWKLTVELTRLVLGTSAQGKEISSLAVSGATYGKKGTAGESKERATARLAARALQIRKEQGLPAEFTSMSKLEEAMKAAQVAAVGEVIFTGAVTDRELLFKIFSTGAAKATFSDLKVAFEVKATQGVKRQSYRLYLHE